MKYLTTLKVLITSQKLAPTRSQPENAVARESEKESESESESEGESEWEQALIRPPRPTYLLAGPRYMAPRPTYLPALLICAFFFKFDFSYC
jgi:hypothetical protein